MAEDQPPLAPPEPFPRSSPNIHDDSTDSNVVSPAGSLSKSNKSKSRKKDKEASAASKRRCVSTACIACRRRKSKVRELDIELLSFLFDIRSWPGRDQTTVSRHRGPE